MTEITVHDRLIDDNDPYVYDTRTPAPFVRRLVDAVRRRAQRFLAGEHGSRSEVMAGVFAASVYWVGMVASMVGAAASRVWRVRRRGLHWIDAD